jgi:hypothetical protein
MPFIPNMRDIVAAEVTEILEEAAEARQLAAMLTDERSIRDLLNYAAELEAGVAQPNAHARQASPSGEERSRRVG